MIKTSLSQSRRVTEIYYFATDTHGKTQTVSSFYWSSSLSWFVGLLITENRMFFARSAYILFILSNMPFKSKLDRIHRINRIIFGPPAI